MCGRYSLKQDLNTVEDQLRLRLSEKAKNWKPPFNIAPSQMAPVVTLDKSVRIDLFYLGLVPHWAKDKKVVYKMVNARSETLLENPSFKPLLVNNKRCLVLADGFFSGKSMEKKSGHLEFTCQIRISFFSPCYGQVGTNLRGKPIIPFPLLPPPRIS